MIVTKNYLVKKDRNIPIEFQQQEKRPYYEFFENH
jgi:hypothetical protein